MFDYMSDIFKKTVTSKAFWVGILLCLTFSVVNPAPAAAEYDCPSMDVLRERYQGDCFPCQIVNVLLASFMRAAGKVYDVSKEAGNKLLFLGTVLWLAFWALKKMSSLSNVEPSSMSNELVVFFGKVVVAFCFINAGIGTLVNYAVNPILGAGADMGTALLLESQNMEMNKDPKSENSYKGPTEIVDKSTMNKILKLSEGVSNEVAMNLIIGNALTCFSVKKGIHLNIPAVITIHIPDIWLWLVGAAIWCAGFMLVLCVCYYLIDIPFKIGFSIIALPVVIGLWPFKMTSGKLKETVGVALNAAGTFMFLALSSSYAMRLIGQSFSNVGGITDKEGKTLTGSNALLQAIYMDNAEYVELVFSFTGGSFLIILFCYIYGFKMISQITDKFPSKFFGTGIVNAGSPIHHMATAATMWASKKAAAPFKMAGDIVAHQAGKAATTVAKAAGNVGIGVAGAAAGSLTRSVATRAQKFGKKMAERARESKEGWDSLDHRDTLNQAGLRTTIGNKLGKLGARAKLGLANTITKTGEHLETGSKYMAAPGERTLSRVQNAWEKGTAEIGQAAKEFGQQLPPGAAKAFNRVGQGLSNLAQAGQDFIDEKSEKLDASMKNKKLRYLHPGKIINKLAVPTLRAAAKSVLEVGNKTGMMLNQVGDGAASRPKPEDIRAQAKKEFAASVGKLGESGRKLATYIPKGVGETVRGLGFYYTGKAEYSNSPVTAFLSQKLGAALTHTGAGIVNNRAAEGTLRHKIASLDKNKLKTVFSGKAILKSAKEGIAGAVERGIVNPWKSDIAGLKRTAGRTADNVSNMGHQISEQWKDSVESMGLSGKGIVDGFRKMPSDFKNAASELGKSVTDLGQTLAGEHGLNYGSGSSTLNKVVTGVSAGLGTAAATRFGNGLVGGALGGMGAIAGRNLYNNTKDAVRETMDAWDNGKIDNLFDLVGAVGHPVMMIPKILSNTASQTVESTYQVAEKTMLAGIDVALTVVSPIKSVARATAHTANIVGHGARMVATPIMTGVNTVLDAGEVGLRAVGLVTRPVVNTVATLAFAPVGFAAKVVDETLYTAYKMTVRPAAELGKAAARGAKVLYKGAELGVKSTKLGRGTIRTFKAGGKTLKVGVKTLKLGRDMIRAAAGEGGRLKEDLTPEEKAQLREERKQRRMEAQRKEQEKQRAREREEQEDARRQQEYHDRFAAEDAQRQAEEEAARIQAQREAEQREAAEASAQFEAETPEQSQHQVLADAIANEEVDGVKNYSNEDLQRILDYQDQLINGTNNATAFESLHENSVSDMQKFAEGKLTINQDSYATMGRFIQTFGTDSHGKLTEVGRAAQTKLTGLMGGGNSGGGGSQN